MKYKRYTKEDFKEMQNGFYLLLFPKSNTLSVKGVYILDGACVNEAMTTINPKFKKLCFLQKYREITWDEEGRILELYDKKNFTDLRVTVPKEKEIQKVSKVKMTDSERRRLYYDTFDKKQREKYFREPKKIFNPGPTAITSNRGEIIA